MALLVTPRTPPTCSASSCCTCGCEAAAGQRSQRRRSACAAACASMTTRLGRRGVYICSWARGKVPALAASSQVGARRLHCAGPAGKSAEERARRVNSPAASQPRQASLCICQLAPRVASDGCRRADMHHACVRLWLSVHATSRPLLACARKPAHSPACLPGPRPLRLAASTRITHRGRAVGGGSVGATCRRREYTGRVTDRDYRGGYEGGRGR